MTRKPFMSPERFGKASEDHYLGFITSYLNKGGKIKPDMLYAAQPNIPVFRVGGFDQFDIAYIHHNQPTYYLFAAGDDIQLDKDRELRTPSNALFLSTKAPLAYTPPPYLTVDIIKKTNVKLDPLTHFFDGDILEYLLLCKCLGDQDQKTFAVSKLINHLLDTRSPEDIETLINQNRSQISVDDRRKAMQFHQRVFICKGPDSGFEDYLKGAVSEKKQVLEVLEHTLQQYQDLYTKVMSWTPYDVTPYNFTPKPQPDPSWKPLGIPKQKPRYKEVNIEEEERLLRMRVMADVRRRGFFR